VFAPNRAHWQLVPVPFGSSMPSSRCATVRFPHDSRYENRVMSTHIIATVILAVTFGAFWHNQPARSPNHQRRDPGFRLGPLVNRVLEWLFLMPHFSNPAEKKKSVFLNGESVIPERQTGFFRQVLRALLVSIPWRRTLVDRAGMRPSRPAYLFKPRVNTNELAAGKTT
jgi:hypothetical protein